MSSLLGVHIRGLMLWILICPKAWIGCFAGDMHKTFSDFMHSSWQVRGYLQELADISKTLQEKKVTATGTKRQYIVNRHRSWICRQLLMFTLLH
jgi:hypothetical protein